MTWQSVDKLAAYASFLRLPFIVKGVLSVSDAVKCVQAGVEAFFRKTGRELAFVMSMTGFSKPEEIDDRALWIPDHFS